MGSCWPNSRVSGRGSTNTAARSSDSTGDGVMVFLQRPTFRDPAERAVRLSIDIPRRPCASLPNDGAATVTLSVGNRDAQNFATPGRIVFEVRFDLPAIGQRDNLAARLCGDARAWQVLVT